MVKRMRRNLIEQGGDKLRNQITDITGITGVKITGLFTDIDTQIGERIIVFTLKDDRENAFP